MIKINVQDFFSGFLGNICSIIQKLVIALGSYFQTGGMYPSLGLPQRSSRFAMGLQNVLGYFLTGMTCSFSGYHITWL